MKHTAAAFDPGPPAGRKPAFAGGTITPAGELKIPKKEVTAPPVLRLQQ